jgi:hypothetical protein
MTRRTEFVTVQPEQVLAAGIDLLQSNQAFQHASYGFVIWSLFTIIFGFGVTLFIVVELFFHNIFGTMVHSKTIQSTRAREREKRMAQA